MEGDLCLVREGHRDSVTMHGVCAPRTGLDRVPVPLPRPCSFCPISALPALHWGSRLPHALAEHASCTCREPDTAATGQRYAGRRAEARDPREEGIPRWWPWSGAGRTGEGQQRSTSHPIAVLRPSPPCQHACGQCLAKTKRCAGWWRRTARSGIYPHGRFLGYPDLRNVHWACCRWALCDCTPAAHT